MWQTIETFPYPEKEWDFSTPSYLLYSKESGIVIGACVLTDAEDKVYRFTFGASAWNVKPTHWMPLPEIPK
jgi:hypothetical protein